MRGVRSCLISGRMDCVNCIAINYLHPCLRGMAFAVPHTLYTTLATGGQVQKSGGIQLLFDDQFFACQPKCELTFSKPANRSQRFRRAPTIPPVALAVEIQNLDFAYGAQLVLKHVSLPIERGSTLGVVGPNGGGKTTLLRLLLGLHVPTRGTITVGGLVPKEAVRRGDRIGYVPQNYSVV